MFSKLDLNAIVKQLLVRRLRERETSPLALSVLTMTLE